MKAWYRWLVSFESVEDIALVICNNIVTQLILHVCHYGTV